MASSGKFLAVKGPGRTFPNEDRAKTVLGGTDLFFHVVRPPGPPGIFTHEIPELLERKLCKWKNL